MALLFIDGFDHYATADLTKKWTSILSGSPTINASLGRRSTGCLVNRTNLLKTLASNYATLVVGVAITPNDLANGVTSFLKLRDAGSEQIDLRWTTLGAIQVTRNGTSLGTSANGVLSDTAYRYVEVKATIHDTTGAVEVRVDGAAVLTLTNVDTKNTANAYVNQVVISGTLTGSSSYYDDFYVCDNSGSTNNDFLGDVRVDALLPNADGDYAQLTPSTGTDHYALVDDATPNTTDYNESATAGHKDAYAMQNLSSITGTIYGVQISIAALKDDAGSRSLKVGVRASGSPGNDSLDAGSALSTSQLYYMKINETDPSTAAAWTESGVNAAQALVEVA